MQLNPKLHQKYIQIIQDKPMIYVKIRKALNDTLCAAYLFSKKLSDQLIKWGFVIIPYDSFVANKSLQKSNAS